MCEGERCGMSVPLLSVRSVVYTPIDYSDTPYFMSHRTGQGCIFAGVSGYLLMMDGWLINMELASLYPFYRGHHISMFFFCMHIYDFNDVPRRQPMRWSSASYPNLIRSCLAHPICTEIGSVFNFYL